MNAAINLPVKNQNLLYSLHNIPVKVVCFVYCLFPINGMTSKFHNTCPLCLDVRPFRVTNVFYLSENNGYPKVTQNSKVTGGLPFRIPQYLKGETAPLATSNFTITDNTFFISFCPQKTWNHIFGKLKLHVFQNFLQDHAPHHQHP